MQCPTLRSDLLQQSKIKDMCFAQILSSQCAINQAHCKWKKQKEDQKILLLEEVLEIIEEMTATVEAEIDKYLHKMGNRLRAYVIKDIKKEDKIAWRNLVDSITYNVLFPGNKIAILEVGTNVPHAKYVHEGRQPGKMPPVDAIKSWLRTKSRRYQKSGFMGIQGFKNNQKAIDSMSWAIARKIKEKGVKAYPFLELALNQNAEYIENELKATLKELEA